MNYFFDTEFREGNQSKKILGVKYGGTKPIIDLISIGIISQDDREYYAISNEFNISNAYADDFVREQVLKKIHGEFSTEPFSLKSLKNVVKHHGKSNRLIATEIIMFIFDKDGCKHDKWLGSSDQYIELLLEDGVKEKPTFFGYVPSTDWVAFYQLFGELRDFPKAFPKNVKCLKNLMEYKGFSRDWRYKNNPKPKNVHNALTAAKWNKNLYIAMHNG